MNNQKVAELVRHYLKDGHLDGITLEVIEPKIRKSKGWWDVPIQLNMEPPIFYKLHEVLINAEIALKDRENITVFLEPIYPKTDDVAEPEPPPKPRKHHGRFTKKKVAAIVREYLKDCHPGGVTLEVLDEDIYKSYYEWRVPIRPNVEPPNWMEYGEARAIVACDILEKEGLNVYLVTVDADEPEVKR
jgi:hypothetical protein